ncbi:hypothetical protein [Streptomyces inhibens]|nr:hypothetical protein [Streptomyces inhibens]
MTVRIHLARTYVARTYVAERSDPLSEALLSLHSYSSAATT